MFHCRWALRCRLCCYLCRVLRAQVEQDDAFHESIIGRISRRLDWSIELSFPPGRHRHPSRRRCRFFSIVMGDLWNFWSFCIVSFVLHIVMMRSSKFKLRGRGICSSYCRHRIRHNAAQWEKWNAMIIRNIRIINNLLLVCCCCIQVSAEFCPLWYEWMHCNSSTFDLVSLSKATTRTFSFHSSE